MSVYWTIIEAKEYAALAAGMSALWVWKEDAK